MVTIQTIAHDSGDLAEASISQGQWMSADKWLLKTVRMLRLPPGYYPDHDWAMAAQAVGMLGGEVVDHPEIQESTGMIDEGPASMKDERSARIALTRIIEADLAKQKGWVDFRFNPNHLPAGPGGGQFTSAGGDGSFVDSGKTTEQAYKDSATGKYSAEREALHQAVVAKAVKGFHSTAQWQSSPLGVSMYPNQAPVATILGGGTASGKTTVSRQIIGDDPNTMRIDPDEIKLAIPEYAQLKQEDLANAAARVHDESSYLTKQIVSEAIANKLNFTYDATTSGNGGVAMAKRLLDQGYNVKVLFVDVPIGIARDRAALRAQSSLDPINKGRVVPDSVIQQSHQGAAEKFLELADIPGLTSVKLYDNSGTSASLVYSRNAGQSREEGTVHDAATWERYKQKAAGNLD